LRDATSNQQKVDYWREQNPHANIGLLCGELSGVIVIDMDPRNGSEVTVAQLAREGKMFPDTVEVATPSGGRHLYYAYDARCAQSGNNKLGPGIDVSSNGHYVVLPPSFWSEKAASYSWKRPPRGTTFQSLPKWVFEALAPRPAPWRRQAAPQAIPYGHLQGYQRQAMADLDRAVRFVSNLRDGRHEAPFKVGCELGAYVHHGLLKKDDLERAVMSACEVNGAVAKYGAYDLLKQIGNGLACARADGLPPLARVHREVQPA
jgi:hypothetical protein